MNKKSKTTDVKKPDVRTVKDAESLDRYVKDLVSAHSTTGTKKNR